MILAEPTGQLEPLFGRDREVATLRAVLDAARAGEGKLVLISGAAGIGKTALIEHVAGAANGNVAVLATASRELMTSPPFSLWADLFTDYQRQSQADAAVAIPATLSSGGDPEHAAGRGELFANALLFVTRLAEQQPVVIVLEDLHWSDDASLEMLHYLAINIEHLPVAIIGSYRDTEVTSGIPLYARLPGLVRDTRATRIELRHIDADAVAALVAARYPMDAPGASGQLASWLYRHGEGIPFFTIELLFNLEADGTLRRQDDSWVLQDLGSVQVPLLVRQFVDQRLERLTPEQVEILQIAAVIGDEVPLDLWTALAGVDDLALIDVIEASQQIGVLRESASGDGYRFSHALFRATLYNQLILPRRRAWHGRVGEHLVSGPAPDPDIVAHHLQLAGDPRAGRWLIDAGRRAIKSFAYEMASQRFEQALGVLGEGELPVSERGWLLCDLAMTFRFADADRGLGYSDRAIRLAIESGDKALELYGLWCRAQIRSLRGDNALDEIGAVAGALDETGLYPGLRGTITLPSGGAVAQAFGRYGSYQAAVEAARGYLAYHPDEVSEAACRAHSALGLAAAGSGDPTAARRAFSEGRAIASQLRDPHLTGMLLNWELMEVVLPYDADLKDARRRLATDALAAWDRVEMPGSASDDSRPSTDMSVYATLLLDGDWDTAEEQALIDLEFDGMRFDALRVLCILAARRGELAAARGYLQRALPQGPATQPSNYYFFSTLWLQRTAVDLALASGDLTLATQWLDTHEAWLAWSGRLLNRVESRVLRGRIHAAQGDLDLAQRYATEALEIAGSPRQPLALLEAERYLGHLAVERGDLDTAIGCLDRALAIATDCAAPYEIALIQIERVNLLRKRGLMDDAVTAAHDVRRTSERLGISPLLDRLAQLEADPVVGPPSEGVPGGLSPRELEVLRLVARGMTDAEVGEQLFISPRTVGRHLRSVYNKLGVNSRTAASAFAYQHGLLAGE
ncbi:MAG: AAA family ATPase [Thermomicrobiales bacterium]